MQLPRSTGSDRSGIHGGLNGTELSRDRNIRRRISELRPMEKVEHIGPVLDQTILMMAAQTRNRIDHILVSDGLKVASLISVVRHRSREGSSPANPG